MNPKNYFARTNPLAAAMILLMITLSGCSKDDEEQTGEKFTMDLTDPAYAALKNPGGWVIVPSKSLLVFYTGRVSYGLYGATDSKCTNCGGTLRWNYVADLGSSTYSCHLCNSEWKMDCSVSKGPATIPLKGYMAQVNGNILTINLGK